MVRLGEPFRSCEGTVLHCSSRGILGDLFGCLGQEKATPHATHTHICPTADTTEWFCLCDKLRDETSLHHRKQASQKRKEKRQAEREAETHKRRERREHAPGSYLWEFVQWLESEKIRDRRVLQLCTLRAQTHHTPSHTHNNNTQRERTRKVIIENAHSHPPTHHISSIWIHPKILLWKR